MAPSRARLPHPTQWARRLLMAHTAHPPNKAVALRTPLGSSAIHPNDYARHGRDRSFTLASTLAKMLTSSTIWKSYMPTQMKSAPLLNA